ncbi:hypothetical protein PHYC_03074 [Phycisphaerales bacterium]|nr:hypothetical protein PHYC_03074 [Phycisphaerales bacterium]
MTGPSPIQEARAAFASLPPLGKAAIGVAALAGAVLLPSLWDLGRAIIGPRPTLPAVAEAEAVSRAPQFETYVGQVTGRSLFYNPKQVAEANPPPPPPSTEDTTPPRPSSYGGPSIAAMIFDEVWFTDGKRMKLGDDEKDDMKVVAMNPPWSATIAWKGVEFPVKLFEKNDVVFKDTPPPTPPPETAPPEPSAEPPKPPDDAPPPTDSPGTTPETPPPAAPPPNEPGSPGTTPPGASPPTDSPKQDRNS